MDASGSAPRGLGGASAHTGRRTGGRAVLSGRHRDETPSPSALPQPGVPPPIAREARPLGHNPKSNMHISRPDASASKMQGKNPS